MKFQTALSNDINTLNLKVNFEHLSSTVSANFSGIHVDQNINLRPFIQSEDKMLSFDCFQMSVLRNSVDLKNENNYCLWFFSVFSQYVIELEFGDRLIN